MANDPQGTSLAQAGQALNDFVSGPVMGATASIERAVDRSFGAVANTIARASLSGRDSVSQLTRSVLADFDRIAVSRFIVRPVEDLVSSFARTLLPVAGARASGGPVTAGQTYLVGEMGPELFTPASNGAIAPGTTPAVQPPAVNITINTPDAQSFLQSRSQVAAVLARAVAQGRRNL